MAPRPRRLIVAGGRNCYDRALVEEIMYQHVIRTDIVVTGGASGVDQIAHDLAKSWGMETDVVPAEWRDEQGNLDHSAGPRRNAIMAETSDVLVALWDGKSTGTRNMIDNALRCGREVHVYKYG